MTTCYNCGGTNGAHESICIGGQVATPPAMNAASPTKQVGCEGADGLLRVHAESATCDVCALTAPVAERAAAIEIDGRTYTAAELKGRIQQLDAEAEAVSQQHAAGAKRIEELEALLAERAAAPASVPEGFALVPESANADEIVTGLYRRFKDWSKRGFGPDDVTWCEVKADVLALLAAPEVAQPAAQGESIDQGKLLELILGWENSAPGSVATKAFDAIVEFIHAWGKSLATPAPTAGEPSAMVPSAGAWGKCVWCEQPSDTTIRTCAAPDGDGHLFQPTKGSQ